MISNGVLNLCPDKPRVLGEIFRVLKSGGRLQMADILLEHRRHARGSDRQRLLVGLNRRGCLGAVAPGDACRCGLCRSETPRLDGLSHFILDAGSNGLGEEGIDERSRGKQWLWLDAGHRRIDHRRIGLIWVLAPNLPRLGRLPGIS